MMVTAHLRTLSTAMVAVLVMALFGSLSSDAGAQQAAIESITDAGVDEDGDGAYESLSIVVTLNVEEAGDFYITGTMLPSGLDESASVRTNLEPGTRTVELLFDGGAINEAGTDGPYNIQLNLFFHQERQESRDYVTSAYTHDEFGAPGPDAGASSFEYNGHFVQVQYDYLELTIDTISPSITFFYTRDQGENARFSVEYTELIAYDDDSGDGALGAGDTEKASVKLSAVDWEHTLYFKSAGDEVLLKSVEVTGMVPLNFGSGSTSLVGVTFYYLFSATLDDETSSHSQRKFDITLEYPDVMQAEAVALRHEVRAVTGEHSIREVRDGEDLTRLEFVDERSGELHGFYEWVSDIDTYPAGGSGTASVLAVAYAGDDDDVYVVEFNYPASGLTGVYHDPVVGVNPDVSFDEVEDKVEEILHNPAVYLAAMMIAAGLVFIPLARRRK